LVNALDGDVVALLVLRHGVHGLGLLGGVERQGAADLLDVVALGDRDGVFLAVDGAAVRLERFLVRLLAVVLHGLHYPVALWLDRLRGGCVILGGSRRRQRAQKRQQQQRANHDCPFHSTWGDGLAPPLRPSRPRPGTSRRPCAGFLPCWTSRST